MANNKICPQCGSTQFMAYIKRGCIVESDGVDEKGEPKFKVLKEGSKENYEIEIIKCINCNTEVTPASLVDGAKCKKCGKSVNPADLNENGVCSVCAMLEDDPSLSKASTDDLLRLLAEARKQANPVKSKIEAKTEKAQAVEEKAATATSGTSDVNDILGGNTQEPPKEDPPKKTRRTKAARKKAEESQESNQEEATAEQVQEAGEELAGNQEAPFPDVQNDMMNQPEPEPQNAETPAEGFQMFDDEDTDQPF